MSAQDRDKGNGQYVHSDMDRMCTCGHTLAVHSSTVTKGCRPCLSGMTTGVACSCKKFRPSKAKGV